MPKVQTVIRIAEHFKTADTPASVRYDVPLANLCTMRVGGVADVVYIPTSPDAFCAAVRMMQKEKVRYIVLGRGSNVIPGDRPFHGIVLLTAGLQNVSINDIYIKAECGLSLRELVRHAVCAGLGGMECLYGIPGTLGGGILMNAGAYGMAVADRLVSATVLSRETGERCVLSREDLCFSYRSSRLQHDRDLLVLDAVFALEKDDPAKLRERITDVIKRRNASQPLAYPSAGSAFRRPDAGDAWRLIDACGLRGYRVGGAQISEKHAGFVINAGHAKAEDITRLVAFVQERVAAVCGVRLTPEIEFIHTE